ncbi:hypothetical protein Esti_006140 [Eimeria stiedai]
MEIYIPPSRAHRASSISLGLVPELPDDMGVLEDAVKEIENAISHLRRSNKEMQEFDPEGVDPDLRDAIAENLEALKKKEERLNHIRRRLAALGARKDACVHNAPAAAAAADRPMSSSSAPPSHGVGPAAEAAAPATAAPAAPAAGETGSATRGSAASETDGLAHLTERLLQLSTSSADRGAPSSPDEPVHGVYL